MTCVECGNEFGSSCFSMSSKPTPCYLCEKLLCSTCGDLYPLVPFDRTNPDTDAANVITKNTKIESFCRACFQKTSLLDYTRTYDVITSSSSSDPNINDNTITFVMVHGGGGCRSMFRGHAQKLADEYGYRSILIDLPGHGTLVDARLTLDSCVETVKKIYEENQLNAKKTIYLGGSLGAYIGFYILSKLSDYFIGAIQIDCGQNVGPDCSFKANAGIVLLRVVCHYMSNKQIMNSMLGLVVQSPADYKLIETSLGCGMFFQQGIEQVACMHTVAPAHYIPQYNFPILFMNGSLDHRDSENKWLELCQDQSKSKLIVYPGGDHFFTHDNRFVSDMILQIHNFVQSIIVAS